MAATKIVFTGGGTGGHLYPALSVARALQTKRPDWEILFVGRRKGFEDAKVRQAGYPFVGVSARGWSRSEMHKNVWVPLALAGSLVQAVYQMLTYRPKAVFATGGYVSAPILAAARLLRVPVAIQEQNTVPGWVIRWSSKFASRIFLAHAAARSHLSSARGQIMELGMPIRALPEESAKALRERHEMTSDKPLLLVFGGSQGSRTLNGWMMQAWKALSHKVGLQIVWQTGPAEWAACKAAVDSNEENLKVLPYLDPVYDYLGMASLVLCRAGASTLAEITAFGLPALMVPLPHAADNHQEKNARFLESQGAAICLIEKNTDAGKLIQTVSALFKQPQRLQEMGRKSRALSKPDAAGKTAEAFITMVEAND